ncbi:MAG TPA: aldo/keto reductase [Bryobacteraceae bacterium]|nr:aldo/keto reductase [Bryobacteraceae bacterium]
MPLSEYVTLGRSGLRVSPLCFGTMTFGTEWGWGADEETCGQLLETYLQAGGNFLDTADLYTLGKSEEICGRLIRDRGLRDRIVLATKFSFNAERRNPNAGGNGRKNIYRAIEGSLRRLQTDYIDLYWMHIWDGTTPVEEVVDSMNDLVRSGKVRYVGFSDVPAWYAARAQTIAQFAPSERIIALQLEYSLVERAIEREHIPAAHELGMGICPWSPLASGFLAGKYKRGEKGGGRLDTMNASGNPGFEKFTDRNWSILDVLLEVAKEIGRPAAEVTLNWVATQPGISSVIIGATKPSQLESNLRSLDFTIPAELRARLDEAGKPETAHPYMMFEAPFPDMINGGVTVRGWK